MEIENVYGKFEELLPYKRTKHLPLKYKEMELILIRRLFKLNLSYLRYLGEIEMHPNFNRKYENSEERIHDELKDKIVR